VEHPSVATLLARAERWTDVKCDLALSGMVRSLIVRGGHPAFLSRRLAAQDRGQRIVLMTAIALGSIAL
jgi:hypothetical protein